MKPFKIAKEALFVALAFALLLTGCISIPEDDRKEADYFYKMGVSYLNEGKLQAAFIQFQKGLQVDPQNKDLLNSLGLVHLQLEEYPKARDLFQRAVAIDPKLSDAYNNLGFSYMKMRQWGEAVTAFRQALANPLYETPERAYYNMGFSYYRMKNYVPAINAFKDAIKRAPAFTLPYYGLALAYNKTGNYGDAALAISRAIDLDSAYKGDKAKFTADMKRQLISARDEEELDVRDYLEIVNY